MVKVSEIRSYGRRAMLVKAAQEHQALGLPVSRTDGSAPMGDPTSVKRLAGILSGGHTIPSYYPGTGGVTDIGDDKSSFIGAYNATRRQAVNPDDLSRAAVAAFSPIDKIRYAAHTNAYDKAVGESMAHLRSRDWSDTVPVHLRKLIRDRYFRERDAYMNAATNKVTGVKSPTIVH